MIVGIDAVTINNVPSSGSIALFTVARTTRNRHIHLESRVEVLTDDDRDGTVQYTPENRTPLRSVWVAAELSSGAYAIAAHPDFPLYMQPLPAASLRKDSTGEIAALELEIPRLLLLLVRPGKGAWLLRSAEGGAGDSDATPNRKLSMLFEHAIPVAGKEKAPANLKSGDFVAAIDPGQLDVWAATIGK